MSAKLSASSTHEHEVEALSGWAMLPINLVLLVTGPVLIIAAAADATATMLGSAIWAAILLLPTALVLSSGHFTLQPNEARVLILFGTYKGTVRKSGFYWANPFYSRHRAKVPLVQLATSSGGKTQRSGVLSPTTGGVAHHRLPTKLSLRAHNFNSDTLKVNDKRGNPVEIAAVVVWRVDDTAQAAFDVEDYESYVQVQSESAIRSIASAYAYDHGEEDEVTLRGGGDEVAQELKRELEVRLAKAGVVVEEARLTHLAYAPEIAHAMLRRQQADAIIAARRVIVHGAVSMVDMALRELDRNDVVKLDDERRAAMVSNLMVVLCGTSEASPVINTGTLYT